MICVHQNDYIEFWDLSSLPVRMVHSERDLTSEEYSMFRQLVGQVNLLANGSRPDTSFSMIDLSTKFNNAHKTHLIKAIKVMKKIKEENVQNVFPKLKSLEELKFAVYTDASVGNLNGVDSCAG